MAGWQHQNPPPPSTLKHQKPRRNEVKFDACTELCRLCGVELTQMPGLQDGTALVISGELGPDFVNRFPTAKHFASWLGLCPDTHAPKPRLVGARQNHNQ